MSSVNMGKLIRKLIDNDNEKSNEVIQLNEIIFRRTVFCIEKRAEWLEIHNDKKKKKGEHLSQKQNLSIFLWLLQQYNYFSFHTDAYNFSESSWSRNQICKSLHNDIHCFFIGWVCMLQRELNYTVIKIELVDIFHKWKGVGWYDSPRCGRSVQVR